jgi:hypothetical protein
MFTFPAYVKTLCLPNLFQNATVLAETVPLLRQIPLQTTLETEAATAGIRVAEIFFPDRWSSCKRLNCHHVAGPANRLAGQPLTAESFIREHGFENGHAPCYL